MTAAEVDEQSAARREQRLDSASADEDELDVDMNGDVDADADAEHEIDDLADAKPKKRRRIIKTSDKKYECPHSSCGKSYSRAEHLYRHQLNHTPKQIYRCDFPGCDRHFVRADLCARHKERHTAKGSHLQRKDAFLNSHKSTNSLSDAVSSAGTTTVTASPVELNHAYASASATESFSVPAGAVQPYSAAPEPQQTSVMAPPTTHVNLPMDPHLDLYTPYPAINGTSHADLPHSAHLDGRSYSYDGTFAQQSTPSTNGYGASQNMPMNSMHSRLPVSSPQSAGPLYSQQTYPSPASTNRNFRSPTSFSNLPSLPPFPFPQGYAPPNGTDAVMHGQNIHQYDQLSSAGSNGLADFNGFDQMLTGYAIPVFGGDLLGRSPSTALDENLLTVLFNTNGIDLGDPSPPAFSEPEAIPLASTPSRLELPKVVIDEKKIDIPRSSSLSNGLDLNLRESQITEQKQRRLYNVVRAFPDTEHSPGRRSKAEFLTGDIEDSEHVMSLPLMKTYLTSYWVHIHQQMPILHRPTFNSETCPDLLLLAMMCLGATCLERAQPVDLTQSSAEWAFFIASQIRWEVFKDPEFRPPAKLWTFQSMLLLELFEKMFSTLALHERAHVHHATTLTVMRRGSSLVGRSALDTLHDGDDPTRTPPGPEGSINTSGQNTPDAYWNRWITAEATRRAAFAAFIIDSTHVTLFGHSAVLSCNDLRLPLPCDEALWSATSGAEVQRVEASLAANGFKPIFFLDALKRTLNGQKVRTNTFGRVILMAGLLNVSWHMNQRDLQVSSLGAASTLGNQTRWRSPLTRAFDFWRRDFDESLAQNDHWLRVCTPTDGEPPCPLDHRDSVFESRTCLHSLAHMSMHVDIIDCYVFAGAERVLGRFVIDADRHAVQRRMREHWAPSARARDATFYALQFLRDVLIPDADVRSPLPPHAPSHHFRPGPSPPRAPPSCAYSARDDYLLNRPWILFFAALIVWSYGFALDGPIKPSNYTLTTPDLRVFDCQSYLLRMAGVPSPDDLEKQKDRNSCLGLLLLLREKFAQPRWELLHEASNVLGSCIDFLLPGHGHGKVA